MPDPSSSSAAPVSNRAISEGGVVTSLTGRAKAPNYGFGFYGPGQPLAPINEGLPPRRWDFQPGTNSNQTPRHSEPFSFAHLRAFANVELVRLAIETRKDQMENQEWQIKPRDNANKAEGDQRIKDVTKFLAKPDGVTNFASFMRALDEDLLCLDAPAVECVRTRGGKLAALELVDGASINLLIDDCGRLPRGDDEIAFQQIIKGVVWAALRNKDLLYLPRNIRTNHLYGFGPVEQIIVTINTILRRQGSQLAYFTEGNIPAGFMAAPESWTNEQIRDLQAWFDGKLSGNSGEQRKVIWGPHGSTYTAFKEAPLKNEFDEWLARIVASAFSLPPTPFVRQMNKGTAGEDQERSLQEGLEPFKAHRKRWLDDLIAKEFGAEDLEFAYVEEIDLDPTKQSVIDDAALKNGSATIDEIRGRRGEDPLSDGLGAKPMVYFSSSVVPLDAVEALIEKETAPPPAPIIAAPGEMPPAGPGKPGKKPAANDAGMAPGKKPKPGAAAEKMEKAARIPPAAAAKMSVDRPKAMRAAAALKRAIAPILEKASHDIAAQVERAIAKAGADPEAEAAKIVAALDLKILMDLEAPLIAEMSEIGEDAASLALASIGVDLESDLVNRVNARAVAYAEQRAAELVSGDDALLLESTRAMIRATIANGLADNIGRDAIAEAIQNGQAFSEYRAGLIADTEIAFANGAAKQEAWDEARLSGIVLVKEWFVSGDEGVCDECENNEAEGEIAFEDDFSSGDDIEPAHPGCRCVTTARVLEAGEDGASDAGDAGDAGDDPEKVAKAAPPALPAIEITVPVTVHTGGKASFERTIVTKHDEQGRILEFERHQIEDPE